MDIIALLSIVSKFVLYAGILFGAGTVFYTILFETEQTKTGFSSRTVILISTAIGIVASIASYGIRAAGLTGEAASMFDPEMLGLLWQTPVGTVFATRIFGLTLILISPFIGALGKVLGAIGSFIALASFAQIGHVTNGESLLPKTLLLVHLVGIAFWLGILLPLLKLSSNESLVTTTGAIAHRFGKIASGFVPILLLAGGWLAFELVGSLQNLISTSYGLTLIGKIVLVSGLLGLAALNKLKFVPGLATDDMVAQKHLRASVHFEIILVVIVLFSTAILTSILTLPKV